MKRIIILLFILLPLISNGQLARYFGYVAPVTTDTAKTPNNLFVGRNVQLPQYATGGIHIVLRTDALGNVKLINLDTVYISQTILNDTSAAIRAYINSLISTYVPISVFLDSLSIHWTAISNRATKSALTDSATAIRLAIPTSLGIINLADYGFRSSNTYLQNRTSFNAAAAAAGIGGTLILPSGASRIHGDSLAMLAGQRLIGFGDSSTMICDTNNSMCILAGKNCAIENIVFMGPGLSATKPLNGMIRMGHSNSGFRFRFNTFYNVNGDTSISTETGGGCFYIVMNGVTFSTNLRGEIASNRMYNCRTGINLGINSEYVNCHDNIAQNSTFPCYVLAGNTKIVGNSFTFCTYPFIFRPGNNGGHSFINHNDFNHAFACIFDLTGQPGVQIISNNFYANDTIFFTGNTSTRIIGCDFDKSGAGYVVLDNNVSLTRSNCKWPRGKNAKVIVRSGDNFIALHDLDTDNPLSVDRNVAQKGFIWSTDTTWVNGKGITIDSNAKVGIGINAPTDNLEIKSNTTGINGVTITTADAAAGSWARLALKNDLGDNNDLYCPNSTSTQTWLANRLLLWSGSGSAGVAIQLQGSGSNDLRLYGGAFSSSANERLRVTHSGNLLLGNGQTALDAATAANTTDKLQVYGSLYTDSATIGGTYASTISATDTIYKKGLNGKLNKVPVSALSSLFIQNQTASAQTGNYWLNGFGFTGKSIANTALAASNNPGLAINSADVKQLTITNGSGTTTDNLNVGLYARAIASGVPNMTSATSLGTYGIWGEFRSTNTTFSSMNSTPAAAMFNLSIDNTVGTTFYGMNITRTHTGTNTVGTEYGLNISAPTGTSLATTNYGLRVQGTQLSLFEGSTSVTSTFTSTNSYSISAIPTVVAGTGAGTTPTVAIETGSTNSRMKVSLTLGTTPAASAIIATITFSGSFAYPTNCKPVASPGNEAAATLSGASQVYCDGSAGSFTLKSNTVPLTGGPYIWYITTGN